MAGAGYKSWVDGDILTAADVNTYLMQQAVMVFADSAARTAAIAAPSEGMTTYLKDTDTVEAYDGSAWVSVSSNPFDIIDAKGDLIVGTADNTASRLAVGANKTVLMADSGETTGLKYGTVPTQYASYDDNTNVASVTLLLPNTEGGGRIVFRGIEPATSNAIFLMRCSTDGGSTFDSTGVYDWTGITKRGSGGSITAIGTANDTSIRLSSEQTSSAGYRGQAELRYSNDGYFKGTITSYSTFAPTNEADLTIISFVYPQVAVNAIQFLFSTGDIDQLTYNAYEES